MGGRASLPLRDLLPEERISCARIRAALGKSEGLGRWSCGHPEAIRPVRLARLLRRYIWQAHDVSLRAVRERLEAASGGAIEYEVAIDVDAGDARPVRVRCCTVLRALPRGRVAAQLHLCLGAAADAGERRVSISAPIML